ncbi:ribulose-phosphate 3-epimerase [Helcococcus sueciensis]|uniref:ribulose-phosphate 3-epimerase n=1 Tax=Helcococcus sueciensis TaxID=241555 RepID=UPI000423B385|nr:ribulose-phosphate 3-epimerase [Helcococcus sueciensis]
MKEIAPSLLAADFYDLKSQIEELNSTRIKYLHLDIMDGNYVPNISYGPDIIKNLRNHTDLIFDVHLMIEKPENYIDNFVDAGADIISFHPETTKHPNRLANYIKSKGVKAGIVLNTHVDESVLKYLIDDIDLILVMTVVPGFGGQSFIPQIMNKIENIRKIIDESNRDIILEVDGGIKIDNIKEVSDAGVDLFVAGSAVFNEKGITNNVNEFYKKLEN